MKFLKKFEVFLDWIVDNLIGLIVFFCFVAMFVAVVFPLIIEIIRKV